MLGHRLVLECASHHEVAGTLRGAVPDVFAKAGIRPMTYQLSAGDTAALEKTLRDFKPDAVVNCIGVIKQKAESLDPEKAIAINSLFPHQLHRPCREVGARLVQMGTDCVFSGTKGSPYTEEDIPDPPDLYGRSKLLGEVTGEGAITLRTSIIGRELGTQYSLLEWAISQKGKTIKGYANALYTGFTTPEMARIIRNVLEKHPTLTGLYHVASAPISKYDLLQRVNQHFKLDLTIEKEELFHMDRRLDGVRFLTDTGYAPPSWGEMIEGLAR